VRSTLCNKKYIIKKKMKIIHENFGSCNNHNQYKNKSYSTVGLSIFSAYNKDILSRNRILSSLVQKSREHCISSLQTKLLWEATHSEIKRHVCTECIFAKSIRRRYSTYMVGSYCTCKRQTLYLRRDPQSPRK
jgi:hypothetical protein